VEEFGNALDGGRHDRPRLGERVDDRSARALAEQAIEHGAISESSSLQKTDDVFEQPGVAPPSVRSSARARPAMIASLSAAQKRRQ